MVLTQAGDAFIHVASNDPIVALIEKATNYEFGELTWYAVLLRLLCACVLGTIIGAERATKSHAAGLRTYILVCLGSCIAMLVNEFLMGNADLSRIGAGVITGIGFIGAGTIVITSRNQVRGLTTAAALWAVACTGLAFGIGFYTLGLMASVLIIIAVMVLPKFESAIQKRAKMYDIHVELLTRPDLKKLLEYLRENNIKVRSIAYDPAYANSGLSVYSLGLASEGKNGKFFSRSELLNELIKLDYVNFCEGIDQ